MLTGVVSSGQTSQDLTFGQVMYPVSHPGEISRAYLSSQLVKPHPSSERQVIHHPL